MYLYNVLLNLRNFKSTRSHHTDPAPHSRASGANYCFTTIKQKIKHTKDIASKTKQWHL